MRHRYTKYISDSEIEDIMESALVGITYWADEIMIVQPAGFNDSGLYNSQAITHGYEVKIHDVEEDRWETLTLRKLLKGLSLLENFNKDDFDSSDADSVIQAALFGKLVYA